MDKVNRDKLLRGVRRDPGICIYFPTTGEPQNKYIEVNRQEQIRYDNLVYKDGWLPNGPVGWWRLKRKGSSEPVPPPPKVWIVQRSKVEE